MEMLNASSSFSAKVVSFFLSCLQSWLLLLALNVNISAVAMQLLQLLLLLLPHACQSRRHLLHKVSSELGPIQYKAVFKYKTRGGLADVKPRNVGLNTVASVIRMNFLHKQKCSALFALH